MLNELRERLSDSKIALCLAEMHGTVRDLLEAEGHFHLLENVGRRVGIAECIDT